MRSLLSAFGQKVMHRLDSIESRKWMSIAVRLALDMHWIYITKHISSALITYDNDCMQLQTRSALSAVQTRGVTILNNSPFSGHSLLLAFQ